MTQSNGAADSIRFFIGSLANEAYMTAIGPPRQESQNKNLFRSRMP
ncbi:hypothetical protein ABEY41_14695 [Peribacillus butanolivorans]